LWVVVIPAPIYLVIWTESAELVGFVISCRNALSLSIPLVSRRI
jgi:hypothetical protein